MKNTSIWLKRHRESAEHVSGFCCPVTGKASDFQFSADHYVLLLIYGWNCCVIPGSVKSMRDHRKHVCRAYEYDCEVSYANSAQIATCRAVGRQSVRNKVLKPGSLEKKVESRYCFIKRQWSAIRYWTEKQESMSNKNSTTTWHCLSSLYSCHTRISYVIIDRTQKCGQLSDIRFMIACRKGSAYA